ncbi:MAG: hypothetical protein ACE5EA_04460 [Nitrospirota bacterium]
MIFRVLRHITLILIVITGIGSFNLLSAQPPEEQLPEESETSETDVMGITFDMKTTIIDRFGNVSTTAVRAYKWGKFVRYEKNDTDNQRKEATIFNFKDLKEYRIFFKDKIYFEYPIHKNYLAKVQREGLIPFEENPNIKIEKIDLARVTADGQKTDLYLRVRSLQQLKKKKRSGRKISEYTLIWGSNALKMPLRILYSQFDYTTIVMEYKNQKSVKLARSLFQPPQGFLNLSPY